MKNISNCLVLYTPLNSLWDSGVNSIDKSIINYVDKKIDGINSYLEVSNVILKHWRVTENEKINFEIHEEYKD